MSIAKVAHEPAGLPVSRAHAEYRFLPWQEKYGADARCLRMTALQSDTAPVARAGARATDAAPVRLTADVPPLQSRQAHRRPRRGPVAIPPRSAPRGATPRTIASACDSATDD